MSPDLGNAAFKIAANESVFAMAGYSSSLTLVPKLIFVLLLKISFVA
jgi:hypothetical protein